MFDRFHVGTKRLPDRFLKSQLSAILQNAYPAAILAAV
jgi:hypothetical protein